MKKTLALRIVLFVFLLAFFSFPAKAKDGILQWPAFETTKAITVVEQKNPSDQPLRYSYVPASTEVYAIKIPENSAISCSIHTAVDDVYVSTENECMVNSYRYYIYKLTAGKEYLISFSGKYTGEVSIVKWDDKLLLPEYPYFKLDEKKSISVNPGENLNFLFSPTVSGIYCLGHNTNDIWVDMTPTYKEVDKLGHEPKQEGDWHLELPTEQRGVLYYLEKGNTYFISIGAKGFSTVKDTFWLQQGKAPYGTWNTKETKTFSKNSDMKEKYYLTVAESGRYMVVKRGGTEFEITDKNDEKVLFSEFYTADVSGYIFDLTAGEEYVVDFWRLPENSCEMRFEKVGPVKSAKIYINSINKRDCLLCLDVDPVCGGYSECVEWKVSDPSVFSIEEKYNHSLRLNILKQGKATVTAKIGNVSTSIELTTNTDAPILREGETLEAYGFYGSFNDVAHIMPSKTGKYQFTVTPKITHPYQYTETGLSIGYDVNYDPIYEKNDISGKHVFTVNLKAGVNYYLTSIGTRYSVVYNYVGGGASQNVSSVTSRPQDSSKPSSTVSESSSSRPNSNAVPATKLYFSSVGVNGSCQIGTTSLQQAASTGSSICVNFPENVAVEFDSDVASSLSSNSAGKDAVIHSVRQNVSDLNENQQQALKGKDVAFVMELKVTVDGDEIHQLGGRAQITIPNPDKSKNWNVLYIADDGTVDIMETICDDNITFSTNHFSHFALVSDNAQSKESSNGWVLPVILIVLFIGGLVAVFIILKKKNFFKK